MLDWLKSFNHVMEDRFSILANLLTGALAVLAWQTIESGGDVFLGFFPIWCAWIFLVEGGIGIFLGILQMFTRR